MAYEMLIVTRRHCSSLPANRWPFRLQKPCEHFCFAFFAVSRCKTVFVESSWIQDFYFEWAETRKKWQKNMESNDGHFANSSIRCRDIKALSIDRSHFSVQRAFKHTTTRRPRRTSQCCDKWVVWDERTNEAFGDHFFSVFFSCFLQNEQKMN